MIRLYSATIAASYALYALFVDTTITNGFDIWALLDKYGYPTALSAILIWFIWNRQKKADEDRNALMVQMNLLQQRNNELTEKLVDAVEKGNSCKFVK